MAMASLSPDKKRNFTTMDTAASSVQTIPKRRSILNDKTENHEMDDEAWVLRTSNQQMRIANLISSPPTPTTSEDSVWTATSAIADVKMKPEKKSDVNEMDLHRPLSAPIVASSTNIPAAFLATTAFASPRDFFIATSSILESDLGTSASTTAEKSHVTCTLCQVTIGNRAYSLKRHLFRHHPHVFRVQTPPMRGNKNENFVSRNSKNDVEINTKCPHGQMVVQLKDTHRAPNGPSKRSKSADWSYKMSGSLRPLNDAFVQWLSSDVIPMKALENQFFREFLTLMNPTFQMPQVSIQPQELHKFQTIAAKKDQLLTTNGSVGYTPLEPRFMKALCFQGNGKAPEFVSDHLVPTPAPHEALIEVIRAGICGTDLQMIEKYKPGFKGILGHEFVGIVRKLGEKYTNDKAIRQMWLDQRVVGEINIPCDASNCATCSLGHPKSEQTLTRDETMRRNHCPNRACLGIVRKDGAFAEFLTLPLANLYLVPESIVDSHAVFAEPLAAACRILEQQLVHSSDHVVILGDGKLGLMTAEVLHATGAAKSITVVGKHGAKLALVKQFVNAVYSVTSDDDDPALVGARITTQSGLFDVCIECTGTPSGIALALELVRQDGTVVVKSTCSAKRSPVDIRVVQSKHLRLVGSRCGPISWALRLLRDRKVDLQKYIHGVYPLARAEAALAHAAQRGTLKIQLLIK